MVRVVIAIFCAAFLVAGGNASSSLESILAGADPMQTLADDVLEQAVVQAKPLLAEGTEAQRNHFALLEIRYLGLRGQYQEALSQAEDLGGKDLPKPWRIRLLELVAQIRNVQGDYVGAFHDLRVAQDLLSWQDPPELAYRVYSTVANMLSVAGLYEQASLVAEHSLSLAKKGSILSDQCTALAILSSTRILLGQYDQAEELIKQQLNISRMASLVLFEADAQHGYAKLASLRGNNQEAELLYDLALQLMEQAGFVRGIQEVKTDKAEALLKLGRYDEALDLLIEILPDVTAIGGLPVIIQANSLLEEIYREQGDYQKAYETLKAKTEAETKLLNRQKAASLAYEQARLQVAQQSAEIQGLKAQQVTAALEKTQQERKLHTVYIASGVAFVLTLLMAGFSINALHQKSHYRKLTEIDKLTGLYNHTKLYELGRNELEHCAHEGQPFTLAVADVDKFKLINDGFGLAGGDSVLVKVAQDLREMAGEGALVGRVGGEEFLLIFPKLSNDEVQELVSHYISEEHFAQHFSNQIKFSLCFGIAEQTDPNVELSDLAANASEALYEAKHRGRNILMVYDDLRAKYWSTKRTNPNADLI